MISGARVRERNIRESQRHFFSALSKMNKLAECENDMSER